MFNFLRRQKTKEESAPKPTTTASTQSPVKTSFAREPSQHKIKAAQLKEKLSTLSEGKGFSDEEKPIIDAMRSGEYSFDELVAMRAKLQASKQT